MTFTIQKKDVKCKMNVFIQYKGVEYDSIDALSGGEFSIIEMIAGSDQLL
jgi:hypothetical protein